MLDDANGRASDLEGAVRRVHGDAELVGEHPHGRRRRRSRRSRGRCWRALRAHTTPTGRVGAAAGAPGPTAGCGRQAGDVTTASGGRRVPKRPLDEADERGARDPLLRPAPHERQPGAAAACAPTRQSARRPSSGRSAALWPACTTVMNGGSSSNIEPHSPAGSSQRRYRSMRTNVAHEVKHCLSRVARLSRRWPSASAAARTDDTAAHADDPPDRRLQLRSCPRTPPAGRRSRRAIASSHSSATSSTRPASQRSRRPTTPNGVATSTPPTSSPSPAASSGRSAGSSSHHPAAATTSSNPSTTIDRHELHAADLVALTIGTPTGWQPSSIASPSSSRPTTSSRRRPPLGPRGCRRQRRMGAPDRPRAAEPRQVTLVRHAGPGRRRHHQDGHSCSSDWSSSPRSASQAARHRPRRGPCSSSTRVTKSSTTSAPPPNDTARPAAAAPEASTTSADRPRRSAPSNAPSRGPSRTVDLMSAPSDICRVTST